MYAHNRWLDGDQVASLSTCSTCASRTSICTIGYSLEGLIKNIGGMDFRYAMRGDGRTRTTIVPGEQIGSAGGASFDQISLAGGLATEVIEGILHRERAAWVAQFSARHASIPSLDEVMGTVVARTWGAAPVAEPNAQALRRTVQRVVLNTLLDRAGDPRALAEVRQAAEWHLQKLDERIANLSGGSPADLWTTTTAA
jgi:hypothetical protein